MSLDPNQVGNDDGGEDWLVSYADMMTLIACFFILMMAFANFDQIGFNQKAEQASKAFRVDKYKSSLFKLKYIQEEMTKYDEPKNRTKISLRDGSLIATYSSSLLFKQGEVFTSEDSLKTLDSMIDIIKETSPSARILIEGHSQDESYEDEKSWEISAKRAAYVAKRFQIHGVPKENITVVAKGDTEPLEKIKKDSDLKSLDVNRRVVVRVLEPKDKEKVKMGFGIYFRDSRETQTEDYLKPIEEQFEVEQQE